MTLQRFLRSTKYRTGTTSLPLYSEGHDMRDPNPSDGVLQELFGLSTSLVVSVLSNHYKNFKCARLVCP